MTDELRRLLHFYLVPRCRYRPREIFVSVGGIWLYRWGSALGTIFGHAAPC
jgi:hypothetical protein